MWLATSSALDSTAPPSLGGKYGGLSILWVQTPQNMGLLLASLTRHGIAIHLRFSQNELPCSSEASERG